MKFSIGVVLYQPDATVLENLKRYQKVTPHLFIYDNSEKSNEVCKEICKEFPGYFSAKGNQGVSQAINYFFGQAQKMKMDFLLTMDQDTLFSETEIQKMLLVIDEDADERCAIYCPNYRKMYEKGDGTGEYVPGDYRIGVEKRKDIHFYMTSGSFCRVSAFKNLVPLDDLFIGYVDYQLCYRAVAAGYTIRMIGEITLDQYIGTTVSDHWYNRKFQIVRHTDTRYYYMFRNNYFLRDEFADHPELIRALRKRILRLTVNIVLGEKKKREKFSAAYQGYRDGKKRIIGKKR